MSILKVNPIKWVAALFGVVAIDTAITAVGLHTGTMEELNPLLLPTIHRWGIPGFIWAKIATVLVGGVIIWFAGRNVPRERLNLYLVAGTMTYATLLSVAILAQVWAASSM